MFKHFLDILIAELKKQGISFLLSVITSVMATWAQGVKSKDFVPNPGETPPTPGVPGKGGSDVTNLFSNLFKR